MKAPETLSHAEQIKAALMDALERSPAEREAFVIALISDPFLRSKVLELIKAHERAGA